MMRDMVKELPYGHARKKGNKQSSPGYLLGCFIIQGGWCGHFTGDDWDKSNVRCKDLFPKRCPKGFDESYLKKHASDKNGGI